jgi:hypothetical protein
VEPAYVDMAFDATGEGEGGQGDISHQVCKKVPP